MLLGGPSNNGTIFKISGFPPYFVTNPVSVTNWAGTNVTFTAAVGGVGTLQYQWFKGSQALSDSNNISGSQSNQLVLRNINLPDAGTYKLTVSNENGSVSASATLTVQVKALASITSPAINTRSTNISWTVTGTASDSYKPNWVAVWFTNINNGIITVFLPCDRWNQSH